MLSIDRYIFSACDVKLPSHHVSHWGLYYLGLCSYSIVGTSELWTLRWVSKHDLNLVLKSRYPCDSGVQANRNAAFRIRGLVSTLCA